MSDAQSGGEWHLDKVLWDEFRALHPDAGAEGTTLDEFHRAVKALPADSQTALCLSGGGIRSASFALGVVQALAKYGLLGKFDYLSTVSGGGYLGGWLTAWRHHAGSDKTVFDALKNPNPDSTGEFAELQALRANSNFLTPKVGLMSADTWTGFALYLRNLLLNWMVLGPLLFTVVAVPVAAAEIVEWARLWPSWAQYVLLAAASPLLAWGLGVSVAYRSGERKPSLSRAEYLRRVLLPIYGAAMLLALYAVQRDVEIATSSAEYTGIARYRAFWVAWGVGVYVLAWLSAKVINARKAEKEWRAAGSAAMGKGAPRPQANIFDFRSRDEDLAPPGWLLVAWVVVGAVTGLVLAWGLRVWAGLSQGWDVMGLHFDASQMADFLVVFGVGWVMMAILFAELVYVGLSSYGKNGDMEREWLARSSGWMAAVALGWGTFALLVLVGPAVAGKLADSVWGVGGASGIFAAAMGASGKIPVKGDRKLFGFLSLMQVVSLATLVFLVALTIVASWLLRDTFFLMVDLTPWADTQFGYVVMALLMVVFLAVLALATSYFVNINRFSLHALYRNRLIRAFLGSARAAQKAAGAIRTPDRFTDFDPTDNVPLKKLVLPAVRPRLFHVVNMALNITATDNLAWQERKAASFTATPLACGSPLVGFRPTGDYAGKGWGLSAGTAIAISGAAVSPNMGYHSSPLVGFLMMLFNVRLGWWLGNPGDEDTFGSEGPLLGISPILRELFGLTDTKSPYVYLSDGGHFENLGIYEMTRRRCRFVLVSDAGADPKCGFEDLGNAVRKIAIDQGVEIKFDKLEIKPRSDTGEPGFYAALGTIRYPEDGANASGTLIYIKPGLYGSEQPDIRGYAAQHPDFPHETTADQWFTESQMESYRSLGFYILQNLCLGYNAKGVRSTSVNAADPVPNLGQLAAHTRYYLS